MFKSSFLPTKFWLFSRKSNNFSQTGIHALKPLGTLLSKGHQSQK
jgi:hypothetical protein